MDENFEYFMEKFGPAIEKRHVPPSSIERYRGKLPDQLLAYWQEHGWCGYADGLFWTVNPQEYEPVLEAWIGDTPFMERDAYHIIARGAFGDLFLWGEKTGDTLSLFAPGSYAIASQPSFTKEELNFGAQCFFSTQKRKGMDFEGEDEKPLFAAALKKLGRLKPDEMYGFVPALALGGSAVLKNLQKVKAVEHLLLLAQLDSLNVMEIPEVKI